jgi:hypothetical protein
MNKSIEQPQVILEVGGEEGYCLQKLRGSSPSFASERHIHNAFVFKVFL